MLEVQKFLRARSPEELTKEFGIRATRHPDLPLWSLKYSQIESPKTDPIVKECRGLVLEEGSWDIVAKPFKRFFNIGECLDEFAQFDWQNFATYDKEDGSLTILYKYRGTWHVNTSGSFGLSTMSSVIPFTWRDLFWKAAPFTPEDLDAAGYGDRPGRTLVFEMCSPYNKIVRYYPRPTLFLLASFNTSGREISCKNVDKMAEKLKVQRPERRYFKDKLEVRDFIEEKRQEDPTWEGFVLKDCNGLRFKWKSPDYVLRHRIKDNGNILHPKRLIPLVLDLEHEEFKLTMPETTTALDKVYEILEESMQEMVLLWEAHKNEQYQKNFANRVKHHPLASIMFKLRKENQFATPEELLRKVREKDSNGEHISAQLIVKKLFNKIFFDADIILPEKVGNV